MSRNYLIGLGCITVTFLACSSEEDKFNAITLKYPETKKIDHTDEYWGEKMADPYRWAGRRQCGRNKGLGKSPKSGFHWIP